MIYYTSDLHFGHANVIDFDNRPFASIDEMDQYIISQWNERVNNDDTVYIIGDVCYRSSKDPYEALIATLDSARYQKIGDAIKDLVA